MNNNPRQARPAFRALRPHHHHHRHGNNQPAHPSPNIVRPRPPSFSRAPWDVTQWLDPITTQKPKEHK